MITYKTFSLVASVIIIVVLIILARKSKIHPSHFLWWVPIIFSIFIFGCFPTLINYIGNLFGISYPPIIVMVFGLGFLLIKILLMDIFITKNNIRYRMLAQKTALLESKLNEQIQMMESQKKESIQT